MGRERMAQRKLERPWKHEWLDLVEDASGLKAPTRHLLLSLGRRMEADGSSCYPSTRTIAQRTGLSERTVCTHLAIAEAAGWLKRSARGRGAGRAWRGHEYRPGVPRDVLKEIQYPKASGAEGDSVAQTLGTEPHDIGVLKEVQSSSTKSSSSNTGGILGERARYSPEQLAVIDEAIEAFASTRKANTISESVVLAELQWWKTHPVEHVIAGLRTYVETGYADDGKRENYARGIVRNLSAKGGPTRPTPAKRKSRIPSTTKTAYLEKLRAQSQGLVS